MSNILYEALLEPHLNNDKVFLIPGHCDPTCNLHDWYVVIQNEVVKEIWPVSARGFSY